MMPTTDEPPRPPADAPADSSGTVRKGHPRGLYVLFFSEMWERFGYYGMRALLVLYMVNYFKWSQERASAIYKWYSSLVFMTPLIGGYIADRYLGNKRTVTIGAVVMSVGFFMLMIDSTPAFATGLCLLVAGNGLFKPNISTQVGRLYAPGDGRRDSAYTIFYMGINTGAGISPLICGYLREHYGFQWGFAAAGVGMLFGLATYLVGMRWVKEISGKEATGDIARIQAAADAQPSVLRSGGANAARGVLAIGVVLALGAVAGYATKRMSADNLLGAAVAAGTVIAAGWVLRQVHGAPRDRVLAIYSIALFVVFFWAAFEQAGNAMNLWADQTTQRYVTMAAPTPSLYPDVAAPVGMPSPILPEEPFHLGAWWHNLWNPVSTEWFQSVNSLTLILFAPFIAMLWSWLDRRGRNPSIPTKMAFGVLGMAAAFGVMVFAARQENQPTEITVASVPAMLQVGPNGAIAYEEAPDLSDAPPPPSSEHHYTPAQGGRLFVDGRTLRMRGVLADVDRDRILRATVPRAFVAKAMELARASQAAKARGGERFSVSVTLDEVPPGFDLRWAGFNPLNLSFDAATRRLTATNLLLRDRDYKMLLLAAADPGFRDALNQLYVTSAKFKVSSWWLVWFYVFSSLGELCLSPVGLSMISKLAPARFATMLMGIWFVMNFLGNFVAGALGEIWGSVPPLAYFGALSACGVAMAMLLFVLVRKITSLTHGVT